MNVCQLIIQHHHLYFMYIIEAGQADVPLSRDFMESELGVKTVSKTRKV